MMPEVRNNLRIPPKAARGVAGNWDAMKPTKGIPRRVFRRAADVLESEEAAAPWFQEPIPALGGVIPLAYARRPGRGHEVYAVLVRIEHGVYS